MVVVVADPIAVVVVVVDDPSVVVVAGPSVVVVVAVAGPSVVVAAVVVVAVVVAVADPSAVAVAVVATAVAAAEKRVVGNGCEGAVVAAGLVVVRIVAGRRDIATDPKRHLLVACFLSHSFYSRCHSTDSIIW